MPLLSRRAMLAFLSLALVSLLADVAYEGGRSSLGPLMISMGASLVAVSVAVYGELASYAARLLSGAIASLRPSRGVYTALLFLGYGLNIAMPLVALAGSWELVLVLFVMERFGKGLRAPVRDTLVAELGEEGVHGKLFGLYELFDQVGAVAGPLIIAYYAASIGLQAAYAILAVPVALSLAVLALALAVYPWRPEAVERRGTVLAARDLVYALTASLPFLTLSHWMVVSGAAYAEGMAAESAIPILYAIAMGVDAVSAPLLGALYDRLGPRSLALAGVLGAAATITYLYAVSPVQLLLGAVVWGAAMGSLETLPRAYIASKVKGRGRPAAYAAYHVLSGIMWGVNALVVSLIPPHPASLLIAAAASAAMVAALLA